MHRRCNKKTIGFDSPNSNKQIEDAEIYKYVTPLDLKKYGLIPEILGRLPVITYTDDLNAKALKRILTEPKNALVKQYEELFRLDGIKLTIKNTALDAIVEHTIDNKLGARGLRGTMEKIMNDAMFNLPSDPNINELIIDKKYVKKYLN